MEQKKFIKKFTKAIQEGNAAIFAGAGASVDAGFVNWKELVKPFSEDIQLDIEKEHDLVGVTQYYINSNLGNRGAINQEIVTNFSSTDAHTDVMDLLTKLPISTYWTTNYDKVIENGLRMNNRRGDIKRKIEDLSINVSDSDAVVYKMHGDVDSPQNAVISKDDYERYNDKNSLFVTALRGDLVSKTFLFIGFSFEDPNLESILGKINVLLGENKRTHYCIQKQVSEEDYEDNEKYNYAKIKQELKIQDLKRYGIETVLVEDYKNVPSLIAKIEEEYLKNTIFISGSISRYDNMWTKERVNEFCYKLANNLVKKNYKIISGFGLGVGSSIINGALDEIYKTKYRHVDEHLSLFPFPQSDNGEKNLKQRWTENREQMISEAGVCIFIFGNKVENNECVKASGMMEEFEIAKNKGKIVIPIGSTGYTTQDIFEEMKESGEYGYLENYWDILQSEDNIQELVCAIDSIIKGGK
ncbi:MAG: SIR2 family protein [Ligilactobacillus animalis]|uniref:SIR2 family protein n=1 Tax=Ligilactobacillus animalis TaxID=1605 RepID=UPI00243025EB|nr:SIR2 family protein [Ligilactobacillus animalis]MCI5941180.1 SIR2 family protein [Ligilactobacillus animalis]MDY2994094.1 SIR2 family protein [Ligilactobacillus animalis]